MIPNKYAKKCQSCGIQVAVGSGFAYKNGNSWFTTCASTACHKRLGIQSQSNQAITQERKLTEDGSIHMPYDRDAIPLLRSLPGARWNGDNKSWTVSIKPADLPRVIEIADQLQLQVSDSLREKLEAGTIDSQKAMIRAEKIRADGKTLYPFQKVGVNFLALHERALLGDDMGIGKSAQSLVALPENASVIVVCPAAVKYNWRDEINMWRPEFKVTICSGRDSFVFPKPGEITICNYDILPSYLSPTKKSGNLSRKGNEILVADLTDEQIKSLSESTLIGDEIHLTKNYKSNRAAKFQQLSRNAKQVWGLTGTPLMNRPSDLFGVLQSLNMNPFGTWDKFVSLFNGYKNTFGGYIFGTPSEEVPERLKRVMLRRLKSEVLKDLPPKTYQKIEIDDLSAALTKRLNEYIIKAAQEEGLIDETKKISSLVKNTDEINVLASKLELTSLPNFKEFSTIRALLAEARIPAMLEIVEGYEESDTPLVVFSAHKKPIEELDKRDGWKIITGDTKSEDRRNIVHEFQEGKLKGIGLTIQAGGVGITLTRASNELFVDLDWTPASNLQAEDRLCRIGATGDNILIQRMSSTHPLDRHMQALLEKKIALIYAALEASIKFKPLKPRPTSVELVEESDEELVARINAAEQEADREVALGKLHGIIGRESAKVNNVPEPELTLGRKEMLRQAYDYMLSICDGAETRDGKGFNKPDAMIARWIGCCLRDEDDISFRALERILVRYRRQLKGKFEEIWRPSLKV
jgi:SWI/SNF-related matrix-associated actin-dependent regulator 1 of chromatin subfamily A